ncbi:MAG: TIGR04283 family arsenosugar biosynthesis glycosyltransferase [Bacteroidota bacterium]
MTEKSGTALISVVIPALNEASCIERTLRAIPLDESPVEMIVVDGGSTDGTPEIAARLARVIRGDRGRARQMNAGAAEARGDILLFLHADTLLPDGALAAIRNALDDPSVEAGAFRLRFDERTPMLRLYSLCTSLPTSRLCFGDRGLFVRRSAFEAVGGFPDIPIFEDAEIVRLLHRRGGFRLLKPAVITSARRFIGNGTIRQQLLNIALVLYFLGGGDPSRATRFYRYEMAAAGK